MIIFVVHNENLLTIYIRDFHNIKFEKTNAFLKIDITIALFFFRFFFVSCVSITNKLNFVNFFDSFILIRTSNNQIVFICFNVCLKNNFCFLLNVILIIFLFKNVISIIIIDIKNFDYLNKQIQC